MGWRVRNSALFWPLFSDFSCISFIFTVHFYLNVEETSGEAHTHKYVRARVISKLWMSKQTAKLDGLQAQSLPNYSQLVQTIEEHKWVDTDNRRRHIHLLAEFEH